jgi:hypothetical protein
MMGRISTYLVRQRELMIRREAEASFAGAVHNCCRVSANNHSLAFAIHRSVKGYPRIEQIKRPEVVALCESDDCVVVKDGYMFELRKETR